MPALAIMLTAEWFKGVYRVSAARRGPRIETAIKPVLIEILEALARRGRGTAATS